MRLLLIIFSLVCQFSAAYAQELQATSSAIRIVIGDPVTLTYSVKCDKNDSIIFEQPDAINAYISDPDAQTKKEEIELEFLEPIFDTAIIRNDSQKWISKFTVTAYDSGKIIIPGLQMIINDSLMYFKDLQFTCDLIPANDTLDIYDINEGFADLPDLPFSFTRFVKNNWWWLLLIIVIPVLYFAVQKRQSKQYAEPEKKTSLKERTLIAIDALEAAKLWEKGELKKHFVELSFILRSYLTARYPISLLEATTYQTKQLLREQGLNDDTIEVIIRILNMSDLVKFAQSKPDVIDILKTCTLARQIVAETSPLEIDKDAE